MSWIYADMTDFTVCSDWWKELMRHFVHVGDELEIRCWREESTGIRQATAYGIPTEEGYEVSVKGSVTPGFLTEMMEEAPADRDLCNKMTKYFTIMVQGPTVYCGSFHYGTEVYVRGPAEELAFLKNLLAPYGDSFSVSEGEGE